MNNRKINSIIKDIKKYFSFLFDKGFEIRHSEYSSQFFGNWIVELESSECVIYITNDRNSILVDFSPKRTEDIKNRFGIGTMIYLLSDGRENIGPYEGNLAWGRKKQLERMAKLLKDNLDKITPFFEKDFEEQRSELVAAQRRYIHSDR